MKVINTERINKIKFYIAVSNLGLKEVKEAAEKGLHVEQTKPIKKWVLEQLFDTGARIELRDNEEVIVLNTEGFLLGWNNIEYRDVFHKLKGNK